MPEYLHRHPEFADLIRIVGEDMGIIPALVEKDYWIMHCLFSLKQAGFQFELKGGTSLSKGFGLIERFSEDIDLRIDPPETLGVATGRNQNKPKQVESRQTFYDWLAHNISINGIEVVERDRRNAGHVQQLGGFVAAMATEDRSFSIDNQRNDEAELLNAAPENFDLRAGMATRVVGIRG
jgi:hypothetical protein